MTPLKLFNILQSAKNKEEFIQILRNNRRLKEEKEIETIRNIKSYQNKNPDVDIIYKGERFH